MLRAPEKQRGAWPADSMTVSRLWPSGISETAGSSREPPVVWIRGGKRGPVGTGPRRLGYCVMSGRSPRVT
jgi:hypothetical protein